jgi:hypothetical protein
MGLCTTYNSLLPFRKSPGVFQPGDVNVIIAPWRIGQQERLCLSYQKDMQRFLNTCFGEFLSRLGNIACDPSVSLAPYMSTGAIASGQARVVETKDRTSVFSSLAHFSLHMLLSWCHGEATWP